MRTTKDSNKRLMPDIFVILALAFCYFRYAVGVILFL